jgi:hypothetical protein
MSEQRRARGGKSIRDNFFSRYFAGILARDEEYRGRIAGQP